jgi:hypothetical protein
MAYATVDELASALRVRVTPENTDTLQACLDAAAVEIDHYIDAAEVVSPGDPLANRVNVLRGVQWWKANDVAFGVGGVPESGTLYAPKDGFAAHGRTLVPLKQKFGVA